MQKWVLLIALTVFPNTTWAVAKIKGAFGVELGQKIHGGLMPVIKGAVVDGEYGITPPKKLELFENYRVFVVPTTKKIYKIAADYIQPSNTECEQRGFELVEILNRKYGQLERRVDAPFHYYKYRGNKRLDLFCILSSVAGKPILRVEVRDAKLNSTAIVEIRRFNQKDIFEAL